MIENDSDFLSLLRVKNVDTLITGNLNIRSISNKFDQLKLFVYMARLMSSLLQKPNRLDLSNFSGYDRGSEVLIYILDDIPSKLLANHKLPHDNERILVELNLRKKKWLLFRS